MKDRICVKKNLLILIVISIFIVMFILPVNSAKSLDFGNVTGAKVDETNIVKTFYVDGSASNASDSNDGSQGAPYKTISKATTEALSLNAQDKNSKIIIKAGIYREAVKVHGKGVNNKASIIIEGQGEVVVKGSIEFNEGWRHENGVYVHNWNYKWGFAKDLFTEYNIFIKEIARRKEMIFVDGKYLIPVLSKDSLSDETYYTDEANSKIYMKLPKNKTLENSKIELANQETILEVHSISNIKIKNMKFTQANPHLPGAATSVYIANNIHMENVLISNSNYMGLGVHVAKDITLDKVYINHNGGGGLCGSTIDNMLISNGETSYNNWRAILAGYADWDSGGIKLLFAYDVKVINHIANDNKTSGIWFDSECRRITIENCITNNNTSIQDGITAGIYLEGGIGPYLVKNCVMDGNWRGINIASANDVVIENSFILNNKEAQITLFNNKGIGRVFKARGTNSDVTSYSIDTVIKNTVISAPAGTNQPMFIYDHSDPGAYITWHKSLINEKVYYYHPNKAQSFLKNDVKTLGSFDEWKGMAKMGDNVIWLDAPFSGKLPDGNKVPVPTAPSTTNKPDEGPIDHNPTDSDDVINDTNTNSSIADKTASNTEADMIAKKPAKNTGLVVLAVILGVIMVGVIAFAVLFFLKYKSDKKEQ